MSKLKSRKLYQMFDTNATPTHKKNGKGNATRTPEYIAWRKAVVNEFIEAGFTEVAEQFDSCANFPKIYISSRTEWLPPEIETIWVCSESPEHNNAVFSNTCDCRVCPDCAARHVARLAKRYIPTALQLSRSNPRFSLRHIVLTTPYSLESDDIDDKYAFFTSMVVSIFDAVLNENWRKNQGLLVAFEFGETGHKLHCHCIHYGQYISQVELSQELKKATNGDASVVWINSLMGLDAKTTENRIIETLKYSVKFWKRDKAGNVHYIDPKLMPKLHRLLHGTRRVRSYGLFYNIDTPDPEPYKCPECGAPMSRCGREHWNIYRETGFLLKEWKLITGNSLKYKLANKSESEGGQGHKKIPTQALLPLDLPAYEPKRKKK